jgi:alpha-tubulin suppressor-like RCC1 family protein
VLIVLNNGELLAWGDNREGQLGLLLRMHYQKPEFVQANRRNVVGVKQVLFLGRETVVVDGEGRVLVCGRAGRYELNF